MSDLEAARRSGNPLDEKAYERLDALRAAFDAAKKAYRKSKSDENRDAFHQARDAYQDARTAQRGVEEADPDHPRGQTLASVSED